MMKLPFAGFMPTLKLSKREVVAPVEKANAFETIDHSLPDAELAECECPNFERCAKNGGCMSEVLAKEAEWKAAHKPLVPESVAAAPFSPKVGEMVEVFGIISEQWLPRKFVRMAGKRFVCLSKNGREIEWDECRPLAPVSAQDEGGWIAHDGSDDAPVPIGTKIQHKWKDTGDSVYPKGEEFSMVSPREHWSGISFYRIIP